MNSMERFEAALNHETPDYVPITFFGGMFETHFVPGLDVAKYASSGLNMAKANIAFYETINPDAIYCLSDVGLVAQGYGIRMKIPKEPDIHMALSNFPIKTPEDWEKLEVLDPRIDGRMRVYLDTCEICTDRYHDTVPIIVSIPSPLTFATRIAHMEDVLMQMITDPESLKKGLETLGGTVIEFINECVKSGAYYDHYLATRASKEIVTDEQYKEFGASYDEMVFRKTPDITHFAHICGVEPYFDLVDEWRRSFDIKGISWWSQGSNPNLKEAKEKWSELCLISGIDHTHTLPNGTPEKIEDEIAQSSRDAKDGGGFILAPGCEISPKTPQDNLRAAVKAARKYGKY
jgi:uroporphyrinogen decarboxylase